MSPSDVLCPDGVDFVDYSLLALFWGDYDCLDSNDCRSVDFDTSGGIDANDLELFFQGWLADKKSFLPGPPTEEIPPHQSVVNARDIVLSWRAGANATSHDVYFGTTSPGTFQANQVEPTFVCGVLENERTYYWRIDERNAYGTTCACQASIGPLRTTV